MRMIITSAATLIGLLLTACAPAAAPIAPTPASAATRMPAATTAPQPTVAPRPTPTGELLSNDVLSIYHKSGCFQGLNETLTIYRDGTLILTDTHGAAQQVQVGIEQLTALQELLAQPEFAQLQPLYQAMGADLCVYTITARRDGQPFSVTTMDGADTPEFLQQVLTAAAHLRELVKLSM